MWGFVGPPAFVSLLVRARLPGSFPDPKWKLRLCLYFALAFGDGLIEGGIPVWKTRPFRSLKFNGVSDAVRLKWSWIFASLKHLCCGHV